MEESERGGMSGLFVLSGIEVSMPIMVHCIERKREGGWRAAPGEGEGGSGVGGGRWRGIKGEGDWKALKP